MRGFTRAFSARDIQLLESILTSPLRQRLPITTLQPWCLSRPPGGYASRRGAKTVTHRKIKDLQQGALKADPLPDYDAENATPYPQYPTVLRGVKDNMAKFENCIVLTRVGNFYELYFEHAEELGPLLNLKVAHKTSKYHPPAPMAGFPFWQLDRFLKILVQDLNKYVAISEEFPVNVAGKIKSNGLLFDRKVARIVTPGTLIDEKFLDPYQNNFLLSVQVPDACEDTVMGNVPSSDHIGLAWLDLSTGEFFTHTTSRLMLASALARIGAREIILPDSISDDVKKEVQTLVGAHHDLVTFHKCENQFISMSTWNEMLDSPVRVADESEFPTWEKLAGHQLLDYVKVRLQDLRLQLQPPRRRQIHQILSIDRNSLRGLEILETSRDGFGKGSLFHAVKRTASKSGARLLRDRLASPSASLVEINDRLDLVSAFFASEELRETLIQRLKRTFDVSRIVQKFTLNKGDADDMLCLAKSIDETDKIYDLLSDAENLSALFESGRHPLKLILKRLELQGPLQLADAIVQAIDEEGLNKIHRQEEDEAADVASAAEAAIMETAPEEIDMLPKRARGKAQLEKQKDREADFQDAWIMRRTASETIGRLHDDLDDLRREKDELEKRLQRELGEKTLSLKWSPGLGHFCHIRGAATATTKKLEAVHARMVSSSKSTRSFYLPEWSRLGSKIEHSKVSIHREEQRLFGELRQHVIQNLVRLRRNAAIMDELDVASAFATLAKEEAWIRPVVDESTNHKIIGGRHPTVKLGLEEQGRSFVSNDLVLDRTEHIWLVTGPNMAGKSTFLRQNALITILAQVGSYVPAEHAEIGLVDQIFSRIGAADDLFRDQSTFMVEMLETATILKQATPRSFVIMDEVGRGTTPEDGTAVGYASLHHLYNINKSRTLFATHFHVLADMTQSWSRLGRYCTDVVEDGSGSFSFVHRLRKGVNRQSHALKVAKLAGLPTPALDVAAAVLRGLHEGKGTNVAHVQHNDHHNDHQYHHQQPMAATG